MSDIIRWHSCRSPVEEKASGHAWNTERWSCLISHRLSQICCYGHMANSSYTVCCAPSNHTVARQPLLCSATRPWWKLCRLGLEVLLLFLHHHLLLLLLNPQHPPAGSKSASPSSSIATRPLTSSSCYTLVLLGRVQQGQTANMEFCWTESKSERETQV